MASEAKSKWDSVYQKIEDQPPLKFGGYFSYWHHHSPRRMMHSMSYYKFAAKMIGTKKRVLDVGCNEGIGTYLLSKECGYCHGLDFDADAVACAKQNFSGENIGFTESDFFEIPDDKKWDAVVNFDVIEHISPEHADHFIGKMASLLNEDGVVVIGTPSKVSQEFASEVSKMGHINIYDHERLEEEMQKHFRHVFMFAANDEVVHTGYMPLAHYFIVVACGPKC